MSAFWESVLARALGSAIPIAFVGKCIWKKYGSRIRTKYSLLAERRPIRSESSQKKKVPGLKPIAFICLAILGCTVLGWHMLDTRQPPRDTIPPPKYEISGAKNGVLTGVLSLVHIQAPTGRKTVDAKVFRQSLESVKSRAKKTQNYLEITSDEWTNPGKYLIMISDEISDQVLELENRWVCDFNKFGNGSPEDPLTYPIYLDGSAITSDDFDVPLQGIVLQPASVDLANPSSLAVSVGLVDLSNLSIEIEFILVKFYPHGGMQLTMPDRVSLQIVDGDQKLISAKYQSDYFDKSGDLTGIRHSVATNYELDTSIKEGQYQKLIIERKGSEMLITINGQKVSYKLPAELAKEVNDTWNSFFVRSYGSVFLIKTIKVS